jgi:hypothetical protein
MDTAPIDTLADLLHETSLRHGQFEAITPPHDWWDWYAAYMTARQGGESEDDAAASAALFMKEARQIVPR